MHLLVCDLPPLRIAWPVDAVREVARAVAVAPLPAAPTLVQGVIDVRGALTPVLDLRVRLGVSPRAVVPSDHLVLLESRGRVVAVHVDRVDGLVRIEDADLRPPSGLAASATSAAGVASTADGLVVVHDVERFLSEAEDAALAIALAVALDDALDDAARRDAGGGRGAA